MATSADYERTPPPLLPCGIALSCAVGAFAVFGWFLSGGILPWRGWDHLGVESAVPALYAVLAIIVQGTNAVAAAAARRAASFELAGSERWARRIVVAGGLWNAYSLENAFSHAAGAHADWLSIATMWAVSAAVAFMEISVYYIDEALKSKTLALKEAALAAELAESRAAQGVRHFGDMRSMTDATLDKAISDTTALKRNLEVERGRRRRKKVRTNEG